MLVERLLRIALLGSSWVMYLLFVLSAFSIGFTIERIVFFWRNSSSSVDALMQKVEALLDKGDYDGAEKELAHDTGFEASVLLLAFHRVNGGAEAFSDAVDGHLARKKRELERGMNFLGTVGANAPFIGLFGTIIGVIVSFQQLSDTGNKAAMGNVMAGIAEALVATGVGLFVAIPAVISYNVIQKQIGHIEENIHSMTKRICALLRARAYGGGGTYRSQPKDGARAGAHAEAE